MNPYYGMLANYFFLFRQISELNVLLRGYILRACFTQEKDTLMMEFSSPSESIHLEFRSTFPNPYLVLRRNFARAKKNQADFWEEFLPSAVKEIGIIRGERIIRIILENDSELILFVRGTKSNILFVHKGIKYPFRKDEDELSNEILDKSSGEFITGEADFFESLQELDSEKHSFMLGSELKSELEARVSGIENAEVTNSELRKIVSGIVVNGSFGIYKDAEEGRHHILPENFISAADLEAVKIYDSALDAAADFIKLKHRNAGLHLKKKNALNRLKAEVKILEKKIADTSKRIQEGNNSEKYQKYADLLLYVPDKKQNGLKQIEVVDPASESAPVNIPLDQKLDINQNRRKYIDKVKKENISYENSVAVLPQLKEKLSNFSELINKIEQTDSVSELDELLPDVPGQQKQKQIPPIQNFRKFDIHENFEVYVGKDSKQNDELTVRFAKPNDLWFHARGVPGSHTVLRDKTGRNEFPKEIIKKAASIAAFFSKAKNAKYVPVAYAEKKYVTKRKGMEAGKVMMTRETIVMVEPGLPDEKN